MEGEIKQEKREIDEQKIDSKLTISKDEMKEWLFGMTMPEIHKQFKRDAPTGKPATCTLHLPSFVFYFLFESSTQIYEDEALMAMVPPAWRQRCFDVGACTGGSAEITKVFFFFPFWFFFYIQKDLKYR